MIHPLTTSRKLTMIILFTCVCSLLLVSVFYAVGSWYNIRQALVREVSVIAQVVADRTTAAIIYDDPDVAAENMAALKTLDSIEAACIHKNDQWFAGYSSDNKTNCEWSPEHLHAGGHQFQDNFLLYAQPIVLAKRQIGVLYIRANLNDYQNRLYQQLLVAFLIILVTGIIAFLFSNRLQNLVFEPVRHLAETAKVIAGEMDYSLRARVPETKDEISELVRTFNDMLDQIEAGHSAMRASEERFRAIFNATNDAIFIHDVETGAILEVNQKVSELYGMSIDEILRTDVESISAGVPPYTQADAMGWIQKAMAQGPQIFEWQSKHKSGRLFWVEVNMRKAAIGPDERIIVSVRDITERKQTEIEIVKHRDHLEEMVESRTTSLTEKTHELEKSQQALQYLLEDVNKANKELEKANEKLKELDQLKSMFIASMSHELRTPLNSIIGFTGIMLQGMSGEINTEQKDHLQRVYRSGKHLLALINDVIDISKIEAGRVKILIEEFDIESVIEEAISTVKPDIDAKGLTLETSLSQNLRLDTDRKRLLQCLLNYLSNAIRYTEKGKIGISLRETDDLVEIAVKDTGIGIKGEDMPKLFGSFVRLDSHLKTQVLGTGLGLYLTKKLVTEVLKGSVSVESTHGKGSTFALRIPKNIEKEEV